MVIKMADTQTDTKLNPESNVKKKTRGPTKQTKYPLPASHTSFDYHLKVLNALIIASNKGSNFSNYSDVSQLSSVHNNTVSKVLKFFSDVGLLERDPKGLYKPKPGLIDYYNKLQWEDSTAYVTFGKLVSTTWFGKHTIQLFQLNRELGKDELIKSFGKCAEADKSNSPELLILIKLLEYGQIIGNDEKSKKYHLIDDTSSHLEIPNQERSDKSEKIVGEQELDTINPPTSNKEKTSKLVSKNYADTHRNNLNNPSQKDPIKIPTSIQPYIHSI